MQKSVVLILWFGHSIVVYVSYKKNYSNQLFVIYISVLLVSGLFHKTFLKFYNESKKKEITYENIVNVQVKALILFLYSLFLYSYSFS